MDGELREQFEQGIDTLVEHDVVTVEDDGAVYTTLEFEKAREVYYDTYGNADQETFEGTAAEVFGLSREEARARIDQHGVTREGLVSFLALRGYVDEDLPQDQLAVLARLVTELGPGSPVPDDVTELDDGTYREFVDDHGDVVVAVWKLHCDPCEELKGEYDRVRAAAPDHVQFAGVDGEAVREFREEFEIEAAPTHLLFRDGDLTDRVRGRPPTDALVDVVESVYG